MVAATCAPHASGSAAVATATADSGSGQVEMLNIAEGFFSIRRRECARSPENNER
jgi:hypothetical protein